MRLLRATILPLLALFSLATLAWGVVSWWTFYRDLYVEEELALQALADEVGAVEYRREGDFDPEGRGKWKGSLGDPAEGIEVPWSVPFAGSVEYARPHHPAVDSRRFRRQETPRSALERVLALPGLRGFDGGDIGERSTEGGDLGLIPLGRPLPELLPVQLTPESLSQPFPSGTPLSDEEHREAVGRLIEAWKTPESDRPRLVRGLSTGPEWDSEPSAAESFYLSDGERSLSYRSSFSGSFSLFVWLWRGGNLAIADGNVIQEANVTADRRVQTTYFDRALPEAESRLPHSPTTRPWGDPVSPSEDEEALLSGGGDRIVSVERIDERRLRVEVRFDPANEDDGDPWRFRAVVRKDLGYALERWDYADLVRGSEANWNLNRELRRLETIDGEVFVVETMSDTIRSTGEDIRAPKYPSETSLPDEPTHERFAVDFDPAYSAAVFDLTAYGVELLPRPRTLPVLRAYRVAWAAGALGLFASVVGALALPSHRRASTGERQGRSLSKLRLRFGMLAAVGVMLIAIGVAGWVKSGMDDAREELALLRELHEADSPLGLHGDGLMYERAKPTFPWVLFSTDALPVGAPLTQISLNRAPAPEVYERLLARQPAIRVVVRDWSMRFDESDREPRPLSIGIAVPTIETAEGRGDEAFPAIERGVPLSSDEAERLAEEIRAAWVRSRKAAFDRYLVRRRYDGELPADEVTLRDGERCWSVDPFERPREIWAYDGRFHRRFGCFDNEWTLIERNDMSEPTTAYWYRPKAFRAVHFSASDDFDGSLVLPEPPFANPGTFVPDRLLLETALSRDDRDVELRIERIDQYRYRIEAERTGESNPAYPAVRSTLWTALVRRDLDWSVERFEVDAKYGHLAASSDVPVDVDPFADLRSDPFETATGSELFASNSEGPEAEAPPESARIVERKRVIRRRNELCRIDGRVVATESQWMGADWPENTELEWHFISEALTVDPPIDERIFDRPTLDSPDPILPGEKSSFRWYVVALLLGAAVFAMEPLRALAKRLTPSSKTAALPIDDSGKDSA